MRRPRKSMTKKLGLPAGSLVHVGEVKTPRPEITLIEYDATEIRERAFTSIEQSRQYTPSLRSLWLNVYGLHEPDVMAEIGRRFDLHPLVLEDILNTHQRPKVDDYGDYLFVVSRFFEFDREADALRSDQVSLVIGHNYVLTFQERRTGSFDPVRERLRTNKGQVRKLSSDYLAYALLDVIVDRYFVVLEELTESAERLEEQLLARVTPVVLEQIHHLKRETLELRRAVWPMREVVNTLQRNDSAFFNVTTLPYLRDVYDHTVHIVESLDSVRDLVAGMLDIYLSSVSNRLNSEVRALTVITTLFMPAALIAGIFGMNFRYMPLLDSPHGFGYAMIGMGLIGAIMIAIFWRRHWLR